MTTKKAGEKDRPCSHMDAYLPSHARNCSEQTPPPAQEGVVEEALKCAAQNCAHEFSTPCEISASEVLASEVLSLRSKLDSAKRERDALKDDPGRIYPHDSRVICPDVDALKQALSSEKAAREKAEKLLTECLCWKSEHCPLHSVGLAEAECRVQAARSELAQVRAAYADAAKLVYEWRPVLAEAMDVVKRAGRRPDGTAWADLNINDLAAKCEAIASEER